MKLIGDVTESGRESDGDGAPPVSIIRPPRVQMNTLNSPDDDKFYIYLYIYTHVYIFIYMSKNLSTSYLSPSH